MSIYSSRLPLRLNRPSAHKTNDARSPTSTAALAAAFAWLSRRRDVLVNHPDQKEEKNKKQYETYEENKKIYNPHKFIPSTSVNNVSKVGLGFAFLVGVAALSMH